jgi:protein-tyrosine kinase
MSVVERALKKLHSSGATDRATSREAIARVTTTGAQRAHSSGSPVIVEARDPRDRRFIEFDLGALSRAGLYSAGNNRLSDQYRMIKRPILKKAANRGAAEGELASIIMVASALPGEGKTFTSVNLSLSLASEKDWSALLVDADCRNPQLSRLLGVANEPGLIDFLRDPNLALNSLIMSTNVDGLSVLPLGQVDEQAAELLASSRMAVLCQTLANLNRHQIVVFDSSPLLMTAESPILSNQVGQVAVVIDANSTPRHAVLEAIEKLDQNKAIGLVLNRASDQGESVAYGSYGAYGYRSS